MLQKYLLTAQPWQKIALKTVGFITACIATLGFLLCIAAFVVVRVDTPDYVLIPLTTGLLTFSSFVDSFFLAKIFKEKGMVIGFVTGLIFVAIVIFLALYNKTFAFSDLLYTKVCAIMMAGLIGGIIGVNN